MSEFQHMCDGTQEECAAKQDTHREAFGAAYQILGAFGAPAWVLDNFSALASDKPAPHPWAEVTDSDSSLAQQRDALAARIPELERWKSIHEKILSDIATAIDPVGPIDVKDILPCIVSDREARQQRDALSEQLEADRTAVADCLTAANKEIDGRHWLTEGRGSYEWNDDRWHDEFYAAAKAIRGALAPLTKIAADWAGCPKSGPEVAKARLDLKVERDAAIAERDSLAARVAELERERDIAKSNALAILAMKSTVDDLLEDAIAERDLLADALGSVRRLIAGEPSTLPPPDCALCSRDVARATEIIDAALAPASIEAAQAQGEKQDQFEVE